MGMDNAGELKKLTREVLGDNPGESFYAKADKMLEDGAWSRAALISATREVEKIVKLFVGVEYANLLGTKYKEYFKDPSFRI
jgi:hypothetical protein